MYFIIILPKASHHILINAAHSYPSMAIKWKIAKEKKTITSLFNCLSLCFKMYSILNQKNEQTKRNQM